MLNSNTSTNNRRGGLTLFYPAVLVWKGGVLNSACPTQAPPASALNTQPSPAPQSLLVPCVVLGLSGQRSCLGRITCTINKEEKKKGRWIRREGAIPKVWKGYRKGGCGELLLSLWRGVPTKGTCRDSALDVAAVSALLVNTLLRNIKDWVTVLCLVVNSFASYRGLWGLRLYLGSLCQWLTELSIVFSLPNSWKFLHFFLLLLLFFHFLMGTFMCPSCCVQWTHRMPWRSLMCVCLDVSLPSAAPQHLPHPIRLIKDNFGFLLCSLTPFFMKISFGLLKSIISFSW